MEGNRRDNILEPLFRHLLNSDDIENNPTRIIVGNEIGGDNDQ